MSARILIIEDKAVLLCDGERVRREGPRERGKLPRQK
jgi:hypothetical protein